MTTSSTTAPAALLTLLLTLTACGSDSTEPPGAPDSPNAVRIAIGDTVEVELTGDAQEASFTVLPEQQVEFAVFGQALAGELTLLLVDSVLGDPLSRHEVPSDPDPSHLTLRRLVAGTAEAGVVLLLRAERVGTRTARLRLFVYPVSRAPEHAPATLAIGDTLDGESFENLADVDEFAFQARAGDELIGFLQGRDSTVPGGAALRIHSPDHLTEIASVVNHAGDIELEAQSTGRFLIPADGTYFASAGHFVHVATEPRPGTGSYRILLRKVDRAPEVAAAALAPGDTLATEAIDFVGDIDEFQVPVAAGATYNVFLRAIGTSATPTLRVGVVGQPGIPERSQVSSQRDTALAGQFTGNFTAEVAATVTVRVEGSSDETGLDRGAYRLFVYPVNRAPELVPAALAAGGSVVETIEYPGDIDEFDITPGSGGVTNVMLGRITRGEPLDLSWPPLPLGPLRHCLAPDGPVEPVCGSGRLQGTSPFRVVVQSQRDITSQFRGSYRLTAVPIDTMPEGQPPSLVIGNTVMESLNPVGDADVYRFAYGEGEVLEINASRGGAGTGALVTIRDSEGALVESHVGALPLASGPFTLPAAGTYEVQVAGAGTAADELGPYSLVVVPGGTGVEGGVSSIAPGDSLTTEITGVRGDVDDFTYSAPPGSEVQAYVLGSAWLTINAIATGSNAVIRAGTESITGRVVIPPSGQIRLRIMEPRFPVSIGLELDAFHFTGPYQLVAHRIDRSPEAVGAALTLGALVDAESIDPIGDVDEFSLAGTAGQVITGAISATGTFDAPRVRVEIVDPLGGTILGAASSNDAVLRSTGPITLPGTRSYTVRVSGELDTEGKGRYRLLVQ